MRLNYKSSDLRLKKKFLLEEHSNDPSLKGVITRCHVHLGCR